MWPTPASRLGYGEMGMFVVAPATSFHHHSSATPSTHHHHHDSSLMSDPHLGVGVGVIPLLTATPCLNVAGVGIDGDGNHNRSGIHLWQQNQYPQIHHQGHSTTNNNQNNSTNNNNNKNKGSINFESVGSGLLFSGGGGSGGAASSGTATCQDCGNQAKKDCSHRRCRTCCRSRGFDCSTHVKSTWVPASRRRERQMMGVVAGVSGGGGGASSGSTSGAKKPRLISTSPSNTPPRSFDTSSSHQDASFKSSLPGQVRAPAVFKCVRVTAVEDGEDEFAYQAVVNIGGHVFKGFLYDQGLESRDGTAFPNLSELHLGGRPNCPAPIVNSSNVYGASIGGSSYAN